MINNFNYRWPNFDDSITDLLIFNQSESKIKKARCIHICWSVIFFFAVCLCLSFPFFVMVKGEGRRISIIYLLIDSLIYLSKMFMHIKNSLQLQQNSLHHCKKFHEA